MWAVSRGVRVTGKGTENSRKNRGSARRLRAAVPKKVQTMPVTDATKDI